jgi:HlyD family secretion protein
MRNGESPSVETIMKQTTAAAGRRRRLLWIGLAALILAAAVLAALASLRRGDGAPLYQTRPVRQGALSVTVSATGNLEATNQVEVGTELSGIITRMTADYNDTVKAGQPLAYLNAVKYEAAVTRSRAEVAAAKANYKEALATREAGRKKLARYRKAREISGGRLPSEDVLEQAEADLAGAEAAVSAKAAAIDVAEATLQSDAADLEKTVIYAPINGIVLSRNVEPGQTVAASLEAPVLYVLAEDLRRMELQVDVDEADVGQVQEGQAAAFTVDAYPERTFQARIIQVRYGAETTDGVVTYKAVLSVDNPELLLRPGMTATAEITVLKIEDGLLVPNAALRFTPAEAAQGADRDGGLLDSLLPGPPRRWRAKKKAGQAPAVSGSQGTVWVLEGGRPAPVAVNILATDGALTAVKSPALSVDQEIIVNALSNPS